MSGLIEGNIEKALGFGVLKIGDLNINLHLTTAKDIIIFQELPIKYIKTKEPSLEDSIKLQQGYRDYFVKYFLDKDPSLDVNQVELLVTKNLNTLIQEFPIALGIRTREEFEQYKKELSDKEKN